MSASKNVHRDAESATGENLVGLDVIAVQSPLSGAAGLSEGADAAASRSAADFASSLAKEWEVARDVIAKGDERTDTLRKSGFTLITSLLTASALVLHGGGESTASTVARSNDTSVATAPASTGATPIPKPSTGTAVTPAQPPAPSDSSAPGTGQNGRNQQSANDNDSSLPWVALGVSIVTAILVVGMRLLEKTTELLQSAAAQRAAVIERHLGLELTDIIMDRHNHEKWRTYSDWFYGLLAVCVCGVAFLAGGWSDLPKHRTIFWARTGMFAAVAVAACAGIAIISLRLKTRYVRTVPEDWSIDRIECKQGDAVRIVYARFGDVPWRFRRGDIIWRAKRQAGVESFDCIADDDDADGDDAAQHLGKAWLWDTTGFARGLYRIVIDPNGVTRRDGRSRPALVLDRRVRVT